jgi:hypothetical protein
MVFPLPQHANTTGIGTTIIMGEGETLFYFDYVEGKVCFSGKLHGLASTGDIYG